MFYYIQGIVAHVAPYLAVLDCSGVGYACKTTNHTLAALTRGKSAKLYTHLYVREEIMELYGFISESELNCFEMLIGVSGVGPKVGLAILSELSPERVALAVAAILLYTLSTRLRESSVDWRIPEDERDEILLRWMKTTVRDAERIMKRGGF